MVDHTNPGVLQEALSLADAGFRVLPVGIFQTGTKQVKKPLCRRGVKDASTETQEVQALFGPHLGMEDNLLIGVAHDSFFVVDVDGEEGRATHLEMQHLFPNPVCTARTRHGYHMYYPYDPEVNKRQIRVAPGIDILAGPKGFVIVPPSKGYEWLGGATIYDLVE